MPVLSPKVTCIMGIHMKPYAFDALASLMNQTLSSIQIIVVDSGQWIGKNDETSLAMESIYKTYFWQPRIEWVFTGESADDYLKFCPISHWTNEVKKQLLIQGEYVCTFYDDDIYEPTFMEKMSHFLDTSPSYDMVRCSQRWLALPDREIKILRADKDIARGETMAGVVDGGQVMMRSELFMSVDLPEDPQSCRISDGVFLNGISQLMKGCGHIDEILYTHRFTPVSTYTKNTQI